MDITHPTKIQPPATQHVTAGPYSPVLEIKAKSLVVISGQAPIREDGSLFETDITIQTEATLASCLTQLESAECNFNDLFKVSVYLTDLANWPEFNRIYAAMMPNPLPVRTAIQAGLLHNFLVEVDMWAAKS
jgi:2-iminobutanoate/2-iminopropanoate deaminase